jgi:hypothetical protein
LVKSILSGDSAKFMRKLNQLKKQGDKNDNAK